MIHLLMFVVEPLSLSILYFGYLRTLYFQIQYSPELFERSYLLNYSIPRNQLRSVTFWKTAIARFR